MGRHALVFGSTGIQGWAVVNELLHGYPTAGAFDRVTALANRPLTENMLWPQSDKLQVVSGINLLAEASQEELERSMEAKIAGLATVTQVFFFAYVFDADPANEIAINVKLLQRAVTAVEHLSPGLEFVVLPTGTKAYGVQCLADFPFHDKLPLSEDLPRIPEPWQSENFYYNQCDWLDEQAKGKNWTWCELRPDVVVGFVPNNNVYCLAQTIATYLACFREVEGPGAECAFPGNEKSWTILSNDSPQDIIARFAITAALHPTTCGQGKAFNVGGRAKPSSWSEKWPVICDFFGLNGVGPTPKPGPMAADYLAAHMSTWKRLEQQHSLVGGRVGNDKSLTGFQMFIMAMFDFDRPMDLARQHEAWKEVGGLEEGDSKAAWWTAFERFRKAKIIP